MDNPEKWQFPSLPHKVGSFKACLPFTYFWLVRQKKVTSPALKPRITKGIQNWGLKIFFNIELPDSFFRLDVHWYFQEERASRTFFAFNPNVSIMGLDDGLARDSVPNHNGSNHETGICRFDKRVQISCSALRLLSRLHSHEHLESPGLL